jgi:peptide/nickel transport system permease protein
VTRYLLGRVGGAALVLALVTCLVFLLFELLPGDAAVTVLSRGGASGALPPEQLAALRHELGLDRPAAERFGSWIGGLATGDLGTSLLSRRPVAEVLGSRIGNSLVLAALTVAVLLPLAVTLGLWAGARPGGRVDRVTSTAAVAVDAVPTFVVGVVLIAVVALGWRLLPAVSLVPAGTSPLARPEILILPVITLLAGLVPHPVRLIRARTAELVDSEFVRTAAVHGVGRFRLLTRHVAPAAVAAALQPVAGSVTGLVGGVAVVETVFAYPGLAQELIGAVAQRDFPVVAAAALLMAVFGVTVYLVADVVALLLSPLARRAVLSGRR